MVFEETTIPYFILLFLIMYYLIQREERVRPCKSLGRYTSSSRVRSGSPSQIPIRSPTSSSPKSSSPTTSSPTTSSPTTSSPTNTPPPRAANTSKRPRTPPRPGSAASVASSSHSARRSTTSSHSTASSPSTPKPRQYTPSPVMARKVPSPVRRAVRRDTGMQTPALRTTLGRV